MVCHVVGVVAQLVEHHNGIVGVVGSIPIGSTSSLFVGAAESFYVRSQVCSPKKRDSFSFLLYGIFLYTTSKFFVKFAISWNFVLCIHDLYVILPCKS